VGHLFLWLEGEGRRNKKKTKHSVSHLTSKISLKTRAVFHHLSL